MVKSLPRTLFKVLIWLALALTGCGSLASTPMAVPTPLPVPTATPTVASAGSTLATATLSPFSCVSTFERRELQEPYQRRAGEVRFTLSTAELDEVLASMGIAAVCIPPELGAPMLNVDWDSAAGGPAQMGRMISLGFESLYPGAGWSDGYLLYATYDFVAGTEYDTFATREDYDALPSGALPGRIEVNGVPGFARLQLASLCMGVCPVYQTWVFPLETEYVVVVYRVGEYDGSTDGELGAAGLQTGGVPAEMPPFAAALDWLATTLRFQPRTSTE